MTTVAQAINNRDVVALGRLLDDGDYYYVEKEPPFKQLHYAACAVQVSVELLDAFLSRGLVQKNTVDAGDLLQWAAGDRQGVHRLEYVLRTLGTDPDTEDSSGHTVLEDIVKISAKRYTRSNVFETRYHNKFLALIEILLKHGANPDRPSKKGMTPRQMAMLSNNDELKALFK